jgi:hypothetical protein
MESGGDAVDFWNLRILGLDEAGLKELYEKVQNVFSQGITFLRKNSTSQNRFFCGTVPLCPFLGTPFAIHYSA